MALRLVANINDMRRQIDWKSTNTLFVILIFVLALVYACLWVLYFLGILGGRP